MSAASKKGGMKVVALAAFGLSYVLNPAYLTGCGGASEEFGYGETEMLALLEAVNGDGLPSVTTEDGSVVELELSLTQVAGQDSAAGERAGRRPFSMLAHACESRTFLASASACIVASTVPVDGSLSLRITPPNGAPPIELSDLPVDGDLTVNGRELDNAYLDLTLKEGGGHLSFKSDGVGPFAPLRGVVSDLGADGVGFTYGDP